MPGAPITRLSNLATLRPESSFESVSHSVQRVIIAANVDGRDLGGVVSDIQKKIAEIVNAPDFPKRSRSLRGQYELMQNSFTSLLLGLVLAVIGLRAFVVLFQSWVDPFIIMMAVPGALLGILWIPRWQDHRNVMSLMGAIMAVESGCPTLSWS
jgi:multidrug efflux pump subunit AcrB